MSVGNLLGVIQQGTTRDDLTMNHIQLVTREVMPASQAVQHAPLPAPVAAAT
jgi:hypothetical protein